MEKVLINIVLQYFSNISCTMRWSVATLNTNWQNRSQISFRESQSNEREQIFFLKNVFPFVPNWFFCKNFVSLQTFSQFFSNLTLNLIALGMYWMADDNSIYRHQRFRFFESVLVVQLQVPVVFWKRCYRILFPTWSSLNWPLNGPLFQYVPTLLSSIWLKFSAQKEMLTVSFQPHALRFAEMFLDLATQDWSLHLSVLFQYVWTFAGTPNFSVDELANTFSLSHIFVKILYLDKLEF